MDSRFRGFSSQLNQDYSTPSATHLSNYASFPDQPKEDGLWSRRNVGLVYQGSEIFQPPVGMVDAIRRDFEIKKKIREDIIAEEADRKRFLEAEVRSELLIKRDQWMRIQSSRSFPSSMTLGIPHSHHDRFLHSQSLDRRTATPFPEHYSDTGRSYSEIGSLEAVPFQRRQQSPEIISCLPKVGEKGVIGLDIPHCPSLSGTKRKPPPPPPAAAGSSEWSCAMCEVSATSERNFQEHLTGKKHQSKEASLRAENQVMMKHKTKKRHSKNLPKRGRNFKGKACARRENV